MVIETPIKEIKRNQRRIRVHVTEMTEANFIEGKVTQRFLCEGSKGLLDSIKLNPW